MKLEGTAGTKGWDTLLEGFGLLADIARASRIREGG
jgi:hypothetical protein